MSREPRPSLVRCAVCGSPVSARDAREAILTWARAASGDGTMTGAAAHLHTNVWVGPCCFTQRIDPRGPQPPALRLLGEQAGRIAREVLSFLIPRRQKLDDGTGRRRFNEVIQSIDPNRRDTA